MVATMAQSPKKRRSTWDQSISLSSCTATTTTTSSCPSMMTKMGNSSSSNDLVTTACLPSPPTIGPIATSAVPSSIALLCPKTSKSKLSMAAATAPYKGSSVGGYRKGTLATMVVATKVTAVTASTIRAPCWIWFSLVAWILYQYLRYTTGWMDVASSSASTSLSSILHVPVVRPSSLSSWTSRPNLVVVNPTKQTKKFAMSATDVIFMPRQNFQTHGLNQSSNDTNGQYTSQSHHTIKQYERFNKRGTRLVMKSIQAVQFETDVKPLLLSLSSPAVEEGEEGKGKPYRTMGDKRPLLDLMQGVGIEQLDDETIRHLPTWQQVLDLYYDGGLQHEEGVAGNFSTFRSLTDPFIISNGCETFRQLVPPNQAYIGTAGLFNSGTNALTYSLRANLRMPYQSKSNFYGILTQVPWHKHWPASQRLLNHRWIKNTGWAQHSSNNNTHIVSTNQVLPIVIIRDPFTWMQSQCQQPYLMEFVHARTGERTRKRPCPYHLTEAVDPWMAVRIPQMSGNYTWPSLAHLWNDWYRTYLAAAEQLPFVMVRVEDMWFQPTMVLDRVRQCAGAIWIDPDQYIQVVDSPKWEHVREQRGRKQSNWISSIIQNAHPIRRAQSWTRADIEQAKAILDPELLGLFHYQLP